MATRTPATQFLDRSGVPFEGVEYDYAASQGQIAVFAAHAIGIEPERMLKTLMTEVDGKPVCVVLPADRSLSMKKVAKAAGGKSAEMMAPAKAERLSGYHTGGISPFGQRSKAAVLFEQSALLYDEVAINGGKRGFLLKLEPNAAVGALGALAADLCA